MNSGADLVLADVQQLSLHGTVTLIHFLWQGALIGLMALAVASRIPATAPQARYGFWVGCLLLMAGCLPVTFIWVSADSSTAAVAFSSVALDSSSSPSSPVGHPVETTSSHPQSNAAAQDTVTSSSRALDAPEASTGGKGSTGAMFGIHILLQRINRALHPWLTEYSHWIACAYLWGVAAMLARLLLGFVGSWRIRRHAVTIKDRSLLTQVKYHATRLGLAALPRVALSSRIGVPVVLGYLKPVVLFPASFVSGLTSDQCAVLIAHELAHIRRWDLWVNLLQRIVEVAFFFHPTVWMVSRRISLEREHCCDRQVLDSGCPQETYLEALVRAAELALASKRSASAAPVGLAALGQHPSQLRLRMMRIMNRTHVRPLDSARNALLVVAVMVLVATVPAWILTAGSLQASHPLSLQPPPSALLSGAAMVARQDMVGPMLDLPPEQAAQWTSTGQDWTAVGRVTDSEGNGLPDVEVRVATGMGTLLGGGRTKTGPDGRFELTFGEGVMLQDPGCQVAMFIPSKPGYVERSRSRPPHVMMARFLPEDPQQIKRDFGIDPEHIALRHKPYTIDFVMTRPATLHVELVDSEGNRIDDAGLQVDDSNQNTQVSGAQPVDASHAWHLCPNKAWTLSVPGVSRRFRTHSSPITLPVAGVYRAKLRWIRGESPYADTLQIEQVVTERGDEIQEQVVGVSLLAQQPVGQAKAEQARQILSELAEVNRYWLTELPPQITGFEYDLRRVGGAATKIRSNLDNERAAHLARMPTYHSALHYLIRPDARLVFRHVEIGEKTITLAYSLADPLRFSVGNGIQGQWNGFVSTNVQQGVLTIERSRHIPLEHSTPWGTEQFSDYHPLDDDHWVPLGIEIHGGLICRWRFQVHDSGLWILQRMFDARDSMRAIMVVEGLVVDR